MAKRKWTRTKNQQLNKLMILLVTTDLDFYNTNQTINNKINLRFRNYKKSPEGHLRYYRKVPFWEWKFMPQRKLRICFTAPPYHLCNEFKQALCIFHVFKLGVGG